MTELKALASRAKQLEEELGTLDASTDAKRISDIDRELISLANQSEEKETALQELHNKQAADQAKLKKMGTMAFVDKGVAIGLGSLVVIGAIVSLFFPVAGLSILAAAGVIGVSYAAGRFIGPIVAPYLKKFGSWVASKFGQEKDNAEEPAPELTEANREKAALIGSAEQEDKLKIENPRPRLSLLDKQSKEELIKLRQDLKIREEHMDEMDRKLTALVEKTMLEAC